MGNPCSFLSSVPIGINQRSSSNAKIALFRSLFRGREDIYPKRFENKKTGKVGYLPVCANEWIIGICEKSKIKCSKCQYRRLLPITDEVTKWHLLGKDNSGKDFIMGIYPMLLDETCFFLAADFDKLRWKDDALAFLKTCHKLNVPAIMERSRSGQGGHIWIFFSEAIPAVLARKLGCYILTETMENHPDIGLDSYDRFFPNQDTLPQGGFGNLIALPLQKQARLIGNSLFVNEEFLPYSDQWAFLSNVRKISKREAENIVYCAEKEGRIMGAHLKPIEEEDVLPWNRMSFNKIILPLQDLPQSIELILSNEIYIPKNGLPLPLKNRLIRQAAFLNPEFYRAQAMRLSTHEKPKMISCSTDHSEHIGLPRGCLEGVCQLLSDLKIKWTIREEFCTGVPLDISFIGELRAEQKIAAHEMLKTNFGILSATTAFGKTVIGAWLLAKRRVNTLILVHRKQLQEQWRSRLIAFLDLPKNAIGSIGGGKRKNTGLVDIAIMQSLFRKSVVDEIVSKYGHIIVDECHHLPAFSFEKILRSAKAKFVTGLSATITRQDGHHPIIIMQCGPVRYRVDAKKAAAMRPFEHTVFVRPTAFYPLKQTNEDRRLQFQQLYEEIIQDQKRNQFICDEIISAVKRDRSPIVLTERNEHLNRLFKMLSLHVKNIIVLNGKMSNQEIYKAMHEIANISTNEERVLLATGKFIGEGFDDARLDTLFLTLPISWKGTITQYVGRLNRLHEKKHEVQVYDYADLNVPTLERMFNKRCKGYEALGYKILLPASALPGWPIEVPLPVDPVWKADYAGSVKRLIRDGVDTPLAQFFGQVAKVLPYDFEGENRARSATERFLYKRLETLPETARKFRLNVELDIPFDGWGRMEVDLLCMKAKLAIELDGEQHLNSQESYRHDRRKDLLLQENGYTILRFLTEDVGKRLDNVLDAILRALSRYR